MRTKAYANITLFCLFCFLMAFFISIRLFEQQGKGWKTIITSDGRGYYAYLPAIFLYHDLTFKKVTWSEKKLYGYADYHPNFLVPYGKQSVNKYFAGEALLLLPFFGLAALFSWIFGLPLNGYSFYFQLFVGLGALFYLFTGLLFLKNILRRMMIHSSAIALTLVVFVLGTNLFYYTIWQASMSHVYSFFAINAFILVVLWTNEKRTLFSSFLLGLSFAVVLLIRPVNGIIILVIPFLFASWSAFVQYLRYIFVGKGLWAFPFLLLLLMIQPLLWYLQTGRFMIWPYQDEGFYFLRPHFFKILFSYRKGLFVYTPLIFVSLLGLFFFFRRSWFRSLFLILFLIAVTWVTASWWNWYYGDGFGMRPFIDFYGIFALLLATLLHPLAMKNRLSIAGILLGLFVFFNLFQSWQYVNGVIQPSNMDPKKYHYVFLKSDSAYIDCLGGMNESPFYGANLEKKVKSFWNDLEKEIPNWNYTARMEKPWKACSGKFVGSLDSLHEFSPGLAVQADSISTHAEKLFCKVSLMVRDSLPGASNPAYFVVSIDSFDNQYNFWYGMKLNDIPQKTTGIWRFCTYQFNLPEITNPKAVIKMYVWNPRRKPFLVDDLRFDFFGPAKKVEKR